MRLLIGLSLMGLLCAALARSEPASETEPTLADAMAASAADLAISYLWVSNMVEMLDSLGGMGATIVLGDESIAPENAEQNKQRFANRLAIYEQAIRQRGQASLAGKYRGVASETCERIGSMWMQGIRTGFVKEVTIGQKTGAKVELIVTASLDEETFQIEHAGAIVENSIAIVDPMNMDYFYRGTFVEDRISFVPDERVLETWPDWADAPKRKDLRKCVVELFPLTQTDGGNE